MLNTTERVTWIEQWHIWMQILKKEKIWLFLKSDLEVIYLIEIHSSGEIYEKAFWNDDVESFSLESFSL